MPRTNFTQVALTVPAPLTRQLRGFVTRYFQELFVLLALVTAFLISFVIPQKFALLNFYYLPVILAGYYLGRRHAVPAALFCVLAISIYGVLFPTAFYERPTTLGVILHITTWGGFLILAAALVGALKEQLMAEFETIQHLNAELQAKQEELLHTNQSLEESRRTAEFLKRKVEDTLYSSMDSVVANLIIEDRLRNEKRPVSILFSDLVSFTPYAEENPPEVVIRDLNRFLSDIEPVLLAYHGHIDKYMGDGIMSEFGAPLDFDTHALLAVLAGLKMQEKLARRAYPWQMRVGIASGSAITGVIGSKRQAYTAIGDVVNLAARLQTQCGPGLVLIDGVTYEGVRRWVEARKKRDLPVHEVVDAEKERQLQAFHDELLAHPEDAQLHYRMGMLYREINEWDEALSCLERALQLDPDSVEFKVAYADTSLRVRETEHIRVKGKRRRVAAYEVVGLKNPLADPQKFPQAFIDAFSHAAGILEIPDDIVLPVEARDGSIGHSKSVAVLAYAVASSFGLPNSEKLDILHAGFVADIGKEAIPVHFLTRRGRLMPNEYEVIKQHPLESVRTLRKLGYDHEARLTLVRHSHERFNGGGFPDGLWGEEIPLGARIIAVADAYDALTSWAPYRDAWERGAALDEVRQGVGRGLYDPRVVEALERLLT